MKLPSAMSGPTINGIFPPYLFTTPPDQRDRENINRMIVKLAAPAAVAEYRCTCIRLRGKRKKKMPSAAYKNRVSRFAPRNERDLKSPSETMGEDTCVSTQRKSARQINPTSKQTTTKGCRQPSFEDSRSPVTPLPRLTVARTAPSQSRRCVSEFRLSGT